MQSMQNIMAKIIKFNTGGEKGLNLSYCGGEESFNGEDFEKKFMKKIKQLY